MLAPMLALPASAFAARRQRVLDALPDGSALLLPTHPEVARNSDVEYPFRPDSDFYWLTGFKEPDAWALLRKDEPHYTLFVRPKDREREIWTGIRAGVEGAIGRYGADQAFPLADLDQELGALLEPVETLFFAMGRSAANDQTLHGLLARLRRGRKLHLGPSAVLEPSRLLADLRLHKTDEELELMRTGAAISGEAHTEAMRQVRPGMNEYEIEALIEYTFRRRGAWGWAYGSIVGGGANACILHYRENDAVLRDGDLMLIDAGAEVDGYATDITRTSPVNGRFSPAQRDLYQLVLDVQVAAVEATKPGLSLQTMHDDVLRGLSQGLLDLGLLSGSLDQILEEKLYRRYYMHRTSHWLGLDVHDVGGYRVAAEGSDGDNRPLAAGMVFTIEPGIYVAPDDEEAPEAFRGIGIRIEDDVLVTETGYENLTDSTPKTIDDIEALQA